MFLPSRQINGNSIRGDDPSVVSLTLTEPSMDIHADDLNMEAVHLGDVLETELIADVRFFLTAGS